MSIKRKIKKRPVLQIEENPFVTYVRTLMFTRLRFKEVEYLKPVHINKEYIEKNFYPWPFYKIGDELNKLEEDGYVKITSDKTTDGNTRYYYEALKPGPVNINMIEPRGKELDDVTRIMMNYVNQVSLPKSLTGNLYFDSFLKAKNENPDLTRLFFTVDDFCGRVHTPVTNMKSEQRAKLLLHGNPTVSFDVATMQPLLLGNILQDNLGKNDFTDWIHKGEDIYIRLQETLGLKTRDVAKRKFFQILFGKPDESLANQFGQSRWIEWVNKVKNQYYPRNPHSLEKNYSNLAWLLQNEEVRIMRKAWKDLIEKNIPFLSVHDEIMVQKQHADEGYNIFVNILKEYFPYFNVKVSPSDIFSGKQHVIFTDKDTSNINSINITTKTRPTLKSHQNPQKSESDNEITENSSTGTGINKKSFQTIGEIFDWYRQRGHDKLPNNAQINAPGWSGNSCYMKASVINSDKKSG